MDVEIHIPHLGYNHYQILRRSVFSHDQVKIKQILPIFPFQLEGGHDRRLNVFGYLYINADKQLPKQWQGINTRVKNVTIESNTFFRYEDDPAARVRIGGELFINHLDENRAIQSNRSGFAVENTDYLIIEEYVGKQIERAVDIVRRNTKIDSIVKRSVTKLGELRSTFDEVLEIQNSRDDADRFKTLDHSNIIINDFTPFSLENQLRQELRKINVSFDFIWSPTLEKEYYQVLPEEDDYYSILVNDKLKQLSFDVAGNSIECLIGYSGDRFPVVIKKSGFVYLNLDNELIPNQDINQVETGFIKVILVMYLNYLRCNANADVLYDTTFEDLSKIM